MTGGAAAITGLAVRLGEMRSLRAGETGAIPPALVAELIERGQDCYSVADDLTAVVASAAQASMEAAGVAPDTVDRVLITSETLVISGSKHEHEAARARLYRELERLGLGAAPVTVFTFAGCGSALSALEYASMLVAAGSARNVLVVAAEKVLDDDSRVLKPAVAVVGDGAAACVVTAEPAGPGLALKWARRRGFLSAAEHDRTSDFGPVLVLLGRALSGLGKEVADLDGARSYSVFTCNNYGLPTVRLLSGVLRVPDDRVFRDNVDRLGTLGSPDLLVNLAAVAGRGGVLSLATGPADCAVAYFEPVA